MVMGRVRATSYVRRTLSQPMHKRRISTFITPRELPLPEDAAAGAGYPHNVISPSLLPPAGTPLHIGGGLCPLTTGVGAPSRQLHLGLLTSDTGHGPGDFTAAGGAIDEEGEEIDGQLLYTFTFRDDVERLFSLLSAKLNCLLIFVPLSFWSVWGEWTPLSIFTCNFFALIPLASLLGNATEELALHTGEITGGLLNATFGNAVEMIMSVQALRVGLLKVVQGTMLGSILSNLLLVLGMSFFAGGIRFHVQKFNEKGATCSVTLLLLSCMSIVIPTVAAFCNDRAAPEHYDIIQISRTIAVLIGLTYCLFLFFQLYTHLSLFRDNETEDEEWPSMSWEMATAILFIVTLLIAIHSGNRAACATPVIELLNEVRQDLQMIADSLNVCGKYLVNSIDGVISKHGLPESFIGLILLPIVGNAAEHLTAVTVAMKNKVDLAMGVAVGSSAQIALFVFPFTVCVGWALGKPLTLAVDPLSAVVLLMAVLVAMAIVQDGESNWLEGVMLMAAYLMIAIVFWYDSEVTHPRSLPHAAPPPASTTIASPASP